jgi:PKD repeat protein
MLQKPLIRKGLTISIIILFGGIGMVSSAGMIIDDHFEGSAGSMFLRNDLLRSAWFIWDAYDDSLLKMTHHGDIDLGEAPGSGLSGGTWIPDNEYPWWAAEYFGGNDGSAIWKINVQGDYEQVTANCGAVLTGLEFNPANGLLYGCEVDALYTIDMTTGDATLVGSMPGRYFVAVGISYEGQGYGIDIATDSLCRINLTDASTELVGSLGIFINYAQDCAFDYEANPEVFYFAAYTFSGALYIIDTETGLCTLVGGFQGGHEMTTFAISYGNKHPVADFTWAPTHPNIGETVYFNASISYDPDGSLEWYDWDWNNDGIYEESTSSPFIFHAWSNGGEIPVALQVWDDLDGHATKTKTITIPINNPPQRPAINGPSEGKVGQLYNYTFNSTDPEGDDVYYYVDWGDASSGWIGPFASGVDATINHTWSRTDLYTIIAKAKDSYDHESNGSTFSVSILQRVLLIGFIHNVITSDDYITFQPIRVLALWLSPISFKSYSFGLMMISKNTSGFLGKSFIIGMFDAAVVANTSASLSDHLKHLFPPYCRFIT